MKSERLWRMTVDYHGLNQIMDPTINAMPNVLLLDNNLMYVLFSFPIRRGLKTVYVHVKPKTTFTDSFASGLC
jgi:hypothetical protein